MRYLFSLGSLLLVGCIISHPIEAPAEENPPEQPGEQEERTDAEEQGEQLVNAASNEVSDLPWREIGQSVQGRPILLTTVGRGPRQVIWVGGIHGDEREGAVATERLPDELRFFGDSADKVTLHMVQNLNPDGTAMGRRGNANGIDLNRNFPADNFNTEDPRYGEEPLSQPESKILHDLILSVEPDLVVVAHAWRGDHFINYDGPAERSAILFSTLSDYPVRPSDTISATPGSLGSWVGVDLGISILTLEYERGVDPEEAWNQTRLAILAVILGD